jgi:hypothetical protein
MNFNSSARAHELSIDDCRALLQDLKGLVTDMWHVTPDRELSDFLHHDLAAQEIEALLICNVRGEYTYKPRVGDARLPCAVLSVVCNNDAKNLRQIFSVRFTHMSAAGPKSGSVTLEYFLSSALAVERAISTEEVLLRA